MASTAPSELGISCREVLVGLKPKWLLLSPTTPQAMLDLCAEGVESVSAAWSLRTRGTNAPWRRSLNEVRGAVMKKGTILNGIGPVGIQCWSNLINEI